LVKAPQATSFTSSLPASPAVGGTHRRELSRRAV
jgi:hypothetical protein